MEASSSRRIGEELSVSAKACGGHLEAFKPGQAKAVFAATLGTVVEYTDWVVYAVFAPILATHFFPAQDKLTSLLATLAVFAVGFVMRPVGGAVLGAYADRHGRRNGLTLTILLMAGASFAIALCPTYDQIGILAPAVLVVARLIQGLSAGGESASATAFLVESAPPGRRAFAGSWQNTAISVGVLLSSGLGLVLSSVADVSQMSVWGWRVAFAVAGALGLLALWIRRTIPETLEPSRDASTSGLGSFRTLFRYNRPDMLRVVAIACSGNLLYYVWLVNYGTYVQLVTDATMTKALFASSISIAIATVVTPLFGVLADKIGRRPVLFGYAVGSALYAGPSLWLLHDGMSIAALVAVHLPALILLSGFNAVANTAIAEQFPTALRATGIGFPYAMSNALFGGTAPYIMAYLNGHGLSDFLPVYMIVSCLVSGTTYFLMRETKGTAL